VLGAYGHSRTRELLFGGCTQHFLEDTAQAVMLMH
jgi:nucleotide-binding universal stress UspA family protein